MKTRYFLKYLVFLYFQKLLFRLIRMQRTFGPVL